MENSEVSVVVVRDVFCGCGEESFGFCEIVVKVEEEL